jgi:hypothetical protein
LGPFSEVEELRMLGIYDPDPDHSCCFADSCRRGGCTLKHPGDLGYVPATFIPCWKGGACDKFPGNCLFKHR